MTYLVTNIVFSVLPLLINCMTLSLQLVCILYYIYIHIHVTYSKDLLCYSHDIICICKLHSLYWCLQNFVVNDNVIHCIDGFWLDLIHKKGNQYDYFFFDLA